MTATKSNCKMAMNIKLPFLRCFLILLSLAIITVESTLVVRKLSERFNSDQSKDVHTLSCNCSNGLNTTEIDRGIGNEIISGDLNCNAYESVCKLPSSCSGCQFSSEFCQLSKKGKDYDCIKDTYVLQDGFFNESMVTDESNSRIKRTLRTCPYPSNLKTADLFCKLSDTKVTCTQTCIIGHTLEHGREVTYRCRKSENKWKPSNFKECKPYIDCTISLTSAGAADCYTPTTKSPAMCYIKCDNYEDKKAVPRRSYTCKRDGTWSKKLPFCAKSGSNLAIVEPPKDE